MKTRIKQIKGILIAILLISGITPVTLWSQATKDFYSVKGVVRDKVTQKTLEYASVTITGTNEGTITNSRGEFSIKIKNSIFRNSLIFQGLPPIKYQNLMYFPLFLPL